MPPVLHQPHPDVEIIAAIFRKMVPGEVQPYDIAAKAVDMSPNDPVFFRRALAARRRLVRERISVVAAGGKRGFLRETPQQTVARHAGRERRSLHRKTERNGRSLSTVDVSALDGEQKSQFFAERTINNIAFVATGHAFKTKLLPVVKASCDTLPMARALELLMNGKQ